MLTRVKKVVCVGNGSGRLRAECRYFRNQRGSDGRGGHILIQALRLRVRLGSSLRIYETAASYKFSYFRHFVSDRLLFTNSKHWRWNNDTFWTYYNGRNRSS